MTADLPETLTERPQWVCWKTEERNGKQTKLPVNPQTKSLASVSNPSTWSNYETAHDAVETNRSLAGVGFVFTTDDPIAGVDLDDCRDPDTGRPRAWAKDIITTLTSYTEVSPSGTGYHVYVKGTLPGGGNRSGNVECYETGRFFTVTGDHVDGTPENVHERQRELEAVHREHLAQTETQREPAETSTSLEDDSLLKRAQNAKNGEKFMRLWRGDISGYDSHSEADMALCFLLAFWTGRDTAQVDRLFRRSGLHRPKWDAVHYGNGRTYGDVTTKRACAETTDVYTPAKSHEREPSTRAHEKKRTAPPSRDQAQHIQEQALRRRVENSMQLAAEAASMSERLEERYEHLSESLRVERSNRERLSRRVDKLEQSQKQTWRARARRFLNS